jgi:hypothetical protein
MADRGGERNFETPSIDVGVPGNECDRIGYFRSGSEAS